MGIIQEVKTVINNQYIHVEDAIKYLAKIEEVSYEDVAQFLLKNKFFELCAGCSYTKSQYIGNFSCIYGNYSRIIRTGAKSGQTLCYRRRCFGTCRPCYWFARRRRHGRRETML